MDTELDAINRSQQTKFPYIQANDEEKVAEADSKEAKQLSAEESLQVTWDGENDPTNPHNWSTLLKWTVTVFMSFGGLITLMSGSMIAPALPTLSHDLHMTEANAELSLSIFILAFAFGPMALAPITEIYGRRPVWLICGAFYSLWSVVCGFSHNKGILVASRLLAGLGASVDFVVAFPVVCDIWKPEDRGKSFAIAGFVPLLGPAIGPLLGGIMTQSVGWRWLFWSTAIFNGCLVILGIFLFPETSEARILRNKAEKLTKETGQRHHTAWEESNMSLAGELWISISRPTRLLMTEPILQLMSIFMAFNFGVLYFVLSTFSLLFTSKYHHSVSQSGLHYISIVIGYLLADQVGGLVTDQLWKHMKKKAGGSTSPEYRVPLMVPGGVFMPIGLIWYGWAAQAQVHWIVPDIGAAIFGCGFILNTNAMAAYVLDVFDKYTASAMAASQVLRMIAGFAFPIFAPAMYKRLDWGWANTILGILSFVIGLLAPVVLWMFGAKIRSMGKSK